MLKEYGLLKDELLACIESLNGDTGVESPSLDNAAVASDWNHDGGLLSSLSHKLKNNVFELVVLGQFKRGKTTLINALLGEEILPTAVVPLTSIATIIEYGEQTRAKVIFNDGHVQEIPPGDIAAYVTERGNPGNEKDVSEVLLTYPSPYLRDGVRLIDTPGVGSIYQHNTDVAYRYLPRSDAALFMLSVDQPVSQAELDFLNDVKAFSHRIFFLENKADFVGDADLEESLAFSRQVLEDCIGGRVQVFPVSARLALEGKTTGSAGRLKQSRLPEFEEQLNRFLMEEKGAVLIQSVAGSLRRHISQSLFEINLEKKALAAPLEELEDKVGVFQRKQEEVLSERRDFEVLFEGDIERLIKVELDERLGEFKRGLTGELEDRIASFYEQNSDLSTRNLHREMEQFIIDEIRSAYDGWWSLEDALLAKAFEDVCNRFINRINETVDNLLRFHAELFDIPYESFDTDELWRIQPGFYYKFRDDPVALELIEKTFTSFLPRLVGRKVVLKQLKDYAQGMIDQQGGRLRHDFVERLKKSAGEFRNEALVRIQSTLAGISGAIDKGMERQLKGGEAARERTDELVIIENNLSQVNEEVRKLAGEMEP
ncbi:bacterial dynamin-like protein [bacterium BMS3Abin01]|nr:bacterial dynamin-like protein [bacterium BMS3Abin01]GBE57749.1 bacterial dynamin-like protein [bacterium BMS3Abin01]HDY69535.1 dynamin [Actinomycetota bacterium]